MFFEKVKTHVKKHKEFYIGLGIGVCFAGITTLIMRGRHARILDGLDKVTVGPPIEIESHARILDGLDEATVQSISILSGNTSPFIDKVIFGADKTVEK